MLAGAQRQHARIRRTILCLGFAVLAHALAPDVSAQEREPSVLTDVVKRVSFDPTTYTPAVIAYYATIRDWRTSQPFFDRGANEMNARFTISGLPNDRPVSYAEGNRRVRRDAFLNLGLSVTSNVAEQLIERWLIERYPHHRTLVRTLGWVERISLSSYLSYQLSIQHIRQAQTNEQQALQRGF
jgi:hypothetical protein